MEWPVGIRTAGAVKKSTVTTVNSAVTNGNNKSFRCCDNTVREVFSSNQLRLNFPISGMRLSFFLNVFHQFFDADALAASFRGQAGKKTLDAGLLLLFGQPGFGAWGSDIASAALLGPNDSLEFQLAIRLRDSVGINVKGFMQGANRRQLISFSQLSPRDCLRDAVNELFINRNPGMEFNRP